MRRCARVLDPVLSQRSCPHIRLRSSTCRRRSVLNARGHARPYSSSISAADLQFGQPVHETHPHLLKAGELTPGITAAEYAARRTKLASKLPEGAVAVLAAADVQYRSGAVFYDFHQESNFFYLTGFNEPEAVAVIGKSSDDTDHVFHLFVREKDPKDEQWEGVRSGTQAALDVFNADEAGDIKSLSKTLPRILGSATKVCTDILSAPNKSLVSRLLRSTSSKSEGLAKMIGSATISPLKEIMNNLRDIKSPAEIDLMRFVGRASGRAFTSAMREPWASEADLAAYMDYTFRRNGCTTSAYIPVVAGGRNASTIHYVSNNHLISPSDMVLVDAGGEHGGYVTDITRTWPANSDSGRFSPAQRDLYTAVLNTQRSCISNCRANALLSLDDLHSAAQSSLSDSLSQLGFNMSPKSIGGEKPIDILFPHHLSHYLGLDVHDTPGRSRKTPLVAGQVVTVEPGIYVPDTDDWPAAFRGMGIRIEDSVCVGEENPLVLTTEAVKEIDDIEALRS